MIEYQGNKYDSKTDVVRDLFSQGKLTMEAHSKKKVADELGMTVQTVHATLKKLMDKGERVIKLKAPATKNTSVTHKHKKESIITVIASGIKKDIDDKSEEVKGKKIKVTWAPNPWGLPITEPPTYVIDDTFKGDVYIYEDENTLSDMVEH